MAADEAAGGDAPAAAAAPAEAVLSCVAYSLASVLLTLCNKAVFSERRLDFPWMLLGLQSAVVSVLLGAYFVVRHGDLPLRHALLRKLALPCVFFTLFIYSNGTSCVSQCVVPLNLLITLRQVCGFALTLWLGTSPLCIRGFSPLVYTIQPER
jgi:hypothetical protein